MAADYLLHVGAEAARTAAHIDALAGARVPVGAPLLEPMLQVEHMPPLRPPELARRKNKMNDKSTLILQ
eukprot:5518806-Pyramimonas_sp.AAC.2